MLILLASLAFGGELTHESVLPDTPSFSTAKKRMYNKVYFDHETTFYCGCAYSSKVPDLSSCGLEVLADAYRAKRTEAEHIVPASEFGATRDCWAIGGRSYCEDNDPVFDTFHSDLHNLTPTVGEINGDRSNLTPAVGEINGDRSNHSFGLIDGEARDYGSCDFERDLEDGRVEPTDDIRGDIARTYFYVEWMYGLELAPGQRVLFLSWHFADPVSEWERTRNERITELQGKPNPFIH